MSRDGRATKVRIDETSVCWHPEVWAELIRRVGVGAVSKYIRDAVYAASVRDDLGLQKVDDWKRGHVDSASSRRRQTEPKVQRGRQSIVMPLMLPQQWMGILRTEFGNTRSKYIKAETQQRLEKETGKLLPVQRGLAPWLGR